MAANAGRGPHSAAPAALGYLYQVRLALYHALERLRIPQTFNVSIETMDDVVFEADGEAVDILQTKHHLDRAADLTDASVDLWKTIKIWCDLFQRGSATDDARIFTLVTTTEAGEGHSTAYLRAGDGRDVQKAIERLNATANSSTNAQNQGAYAAFRALSEANKALLFGNVYVADKADNIAELDQKLRACVYYAVDAAKVGAFLSRLEGWWFRRVVSHLHEADAWPIFSEEISFEVDDIREQFRRENLPIDHDLLMASIDGSGYQDRVFVEQLKLIGLSSPRILIAINDYFKAYEQRSRWMREDLVLFPELSGYERTLTDEWNRRFESMKQELGATATEEQMQQSAMVLYKWVEQDLHPRIRPHVDAAFVSRGSLHMLADAEVDKEPKIGWHADFRNRIRDILQARGQ